ncbi:hypothetical protein IQ249_22155 [Lusitaniella coriacea LEGE 07157]|uniref:Uncharacterized protein n=1 Tax=Lusitaniella coriacea LEGE 07157 TaxID=945747 RepID=A0A8J7DZN2_9CYAN|nr:hypothetical protein [Lusitaniella coriacea]MBE9118596.1 hypothetical protein [Lusitaniella coriacea LEGE 07157]
MTYSSFSLHRVKKAFGLTEQSVPLFCEVADVEPSSWLQETLSYSLKLALSSSSEKARSEFIIAPILIELERRNPNRLSIYSGEKLDVDEAQGLRGECDFILSKSPVSLTIQAPILSLVEAKKSDIKGGLGQCIAQMLGAQRFNEIENTIISTIYGCVTTGEDWQFLKLEETCISIHNQRYYISELATLLGIFQFIVDSYKL